MEATNYISIIHYAEWEKLYQTYSEEHAFNAINKNGIFYFRLKENNAASLQSLDKTLFAKRPDVTLIILPAQDAEKPNKFHPYTKEDFETLSQLKNVQKLGISIAVKQSFSNFSSIEWVAELFVYVDVKSDLHLLEKFPHIKNLHLQGKFTEVESLCSLKNLRGLSLSDFQGIDFSGLNDLSLKTLSISDCQASENFSLLVSDNLEYLKLSRIKKILNIDFISNATNLKKLYLDEFALTTLPDFSRNQQLTMLQINEMHQLNNIETLADSNIEYLFVLVSADKVSAKAFAEILTKMKMLKKALMRLMDRTDKRYKTIINHLEKTGQADLISDNMNFFEIS